MLAIWRSTKPLHLENAPGWILSIVAARSFDIGRSRSRRTKREERMSKEQSVSSVSVEDDVEGNELIAVLRSHIDQLPDLERTLLVCSYCTSMAQRDIAKMVGVSQMTVSNKIQQALDRLRATLTKAGVAAVVPLVSAEGLLEALTTGKECPPGLADRMMLRIERHEKAARSLSRRASSPRPGGWARPACAAVVLAAGLGGAWWLAQPKGQVAPAPAPAAKPVTADAPLAVMNAEKPIHARWLFEKGPAADLKVLDGNWTWKSAPAIGGQMSASAAAPALVALPLEFPAHPVVINIKANFDVAGDHFQGAFWINETTIVPIRRWIKPISPPSSATPGFNSRIYFIDRYQVVQVNGQTCGVYEGPRPYSSRRVAVLFAGLNVEKIEVDSLQASETPEFLHNIPQVIKELNVEPVDLDERGHVITPAEKK
jgi:RNA polymerase sigma factor (sigma-70 family)